MKEKKKKNKTQEKGKKREKNDRREEEKNNKKQCLQAEAYIAYPYIKQFKHQAYTSLMQALLISIQIKILISTTKIQF